MGEREHQSHCGGVVEDLRSTFLLLHVSLVICTLALFGFAAVVIPDARSGRGMKTNERLRNCSTMKRPEPHQDFEKTIQRLKTQKAAQKKPASAPLEMALHERNKGEVAHTHVNEIPLNNYTKHP